MAWTVVTAHYPALVIGGFLFFLGFAKATAPFQGRFDLRAPLLVGFFLGGLVIHGGLQGWWIQPFLGSLTETPAVLRSDAADGVQRQRADHLSGDAGPESQRRNSRSPSSRARSRAAGSPSSPMPRIRPASRCSHGYFDGAIYPIGLLLGALLPTVIAIVMFRLI